MQITKHIKVCYDMLDTELKFLGAAKTSPQLKNKEIRYVGKKV
jgi:hypothetical protein